MNANPCPTIQNGRVRTSRRRRRRRRNAMIIPSDKTNRGREDLVYSETSGSWISVARSFFERNPLRRTIKLANARIERCFGCHTTNPVPPVRPRKRAWKSPGVTLGEALPLLRASFFDPSASWITKQFVPLPIERFAILVSRTEVPGKCSNFRGGDIFSFLFFFFLFFLLSSFAMRWFTVRRSPLRKS